MSELESKKSKNFHFILQGKGGIGKTTCASFIAQYLKDHLHQEYLAIDTDQINASFASFKSLNVEPLNIMENNQILPRGWDTLIEKIINSDKANIIIDNGASSFVPLVAYSLENDMIDLLTAEENSYTGNVFIHVVIAGGEGLAHTLAGLNMICEKFNHDHVMIVVWLNSFLGSIEQAGKQFKDMDEYKKNKSKIFTVIQIPSYTSDTFGKDISDMLSKNRIFSEMIVSPSVNIASRHRYKKVQKELFTLLDNINDIFEENE